MIEGIKATVEAARSFRIEEQRLASRASPPNFLQRYDERLAVMRMLLGQPPGRRSPHQAVFRLESTAGIASAALHLLKGLMRSEEVERAAQDVEAYCLSLVGSDQQGSLRSGAEDVAHLAVEDAILYAVERLLRERAAARKVVARTKSKKAGWTPEKREAARQRARRQHAERAR